MWTSFKNLLKKINQLNPNTILVVCFALYLLVLFSDFIYMGEKLFLLLLIFFISKFQISSSKWQDNNIKGRIFYKVGFYFSITALLPFFIYSIFSATLLARHFSISKLTLYYALEEPHFYEEADINIKKIGLDGFGLHKTVFVQDCYGAPEIPLCAGYEKNDDLCFPY